DRTVHRRAGRSTDRRSCLRDASRTERPESGRTHLPERRVVDRAETARAGLPTDMFARSQTGPLVEQIERLAFFSTFGWPLSSTALEDGTAGASKMLRKRRPGLWRSGPMTAGMDPRVGSWVAG